MYGEEQERLLTAQGWGGRHGRAPVQQDLGSPRVTLADGVGVAMASSEGSPALSEQELMWHGGVGGPTGDRELRGWERGRCTGTLELGPGLTGERGGHGLRVWRRQSWGPQLQTLGWYSSLTPKPGSTPLHSSCSPVPASPIHLGSLGYQVAGAGGLFKPH